MNFLKTTLLLLLIANCISCSKENNEVTTEAKVYQVVTEASCLNNTLEDVSNYDMYIEFDSPSFTPIANNWYKVEGGFFYYKITNTTPVKGKLSQMVLISKHFTTYCK
jgi:hypothetical protein